MSQSLDEVFFTYVDSEDAAEGNWPTPPPGEELARRHEYFQIYLDCHELSPADQQTLLETYEGYLLVKYAFSGLPQPSARTTMK